jgi:hypothetical protein
MVQERRQVNNRNREPPGNEKEKASYTAKTKAYETRAYEVNKDYICRTCHNRVDRFRNAAIILAQFRIFFRKRLAFVPEGWYNGAVVYLLHRSIVLWAFN